MYRTVILSLVLYGYETWSVTFMEEHRLMVLANGLLTRMFGSEREGVTGQWRKWNFTICTVHGMLLVWVRWAGHVACVGEEETCIGVLWVKPEGKKPFGKVITWKVK